MNNIYFKSRYNPPPRPPQWKDDSSDEEDTNICDDDEECGDFGSGVYFECKEIIFRTILLRSTLHVVIYLYKNKNNLLQKALYTLNR